MEGSVGELKRVPQPSVLKDNIESKTKKRKKKKKKKKSSNKRNNKNKYKNERNNINNTNNINIINSNYDDGTEREKVINRLTASCPLPRRRQQSSQSRYKVSM